MVKMVQEGSPQQGEEPTNASEHTPFGPHSQIPEIPSHHVSFFGLSRVVIAVIASITWMAVSSGLIMLNKDLLSNGFPYPMALSGLGMLFSGCAGFITCKVLRLVEAKRTVTLNFYVTKMLPVGFFMALTLHFGNLVYLYLSVSFIQMLKAFTPIITMLALFIAQLETPTRRLILSVCFIAFGTALASLGEVNLSAIGVLCMFLSETFESTRLVMTQLLLTGLKFHPIEGLMYLAPACFFWLLLGSATLEFKKILLEGGIEMIMNNKVKFLAAAVMGFGVNSLAYIVIQTASSPTLKVLGTVKNALVVYLGVALLHEEVTMLQGIGYGISVAAFFWYQQIKMNDMRKEESEESSAASKEHSLPAWWMRTESGKYELAAHHRHTSGSMQRQHSVQEGTPSKPAYVADNGNTD